VTCARATASAAHDQAKRKILGETASACRHGTSPTRGPGLREALGGALGREGLVGDGTSQRRSRPYLPRCRPTPWWPPGAAVVLWRLPPDARRPPLQPTRPASARAPRPLAGQLRSSRDPVSTCTVPTRLPASASGPPAGPLDRRIGMTIPAGPNRLAGQHRDVVRELLQRPIWDTRGVAPHGPWPAAGEPAR